MKDLNNKTKEELLDMMRKIAAEIGMIEIQRKSGRYVSIKELLQKQKELSIVSRQYKKAYFKTTTI